MLEIELNAFSILDGWTQIYYSIDTRDNRLKLKSDVFGC